MQGSAPWGSVLDAGTGEHSLEFLLTLPTKDWTAVTGDPHRAREMNLAFAPRMRPQDLLLAGNWTDPTLLAGRKFNVVLADYLLGALDGFAPYFQDQLFHRLRALVGERLYLVGLEPLPDPAPTPGGTLILEISRLRDACILLAGHRCYREYPLDWVHRHLEKAGFRVMATREVPILYRLPWLERQLNVCTSKLPLLKDRSLAEALSQHIGALRRRARDLPEAREGIPLGTDYVVGAEPVSFE